MQISGNVESTPAIHRGRQLPDTEPGGSGDLVRVRRHDRVEYPMWSEGLDDERAGALVPDHYRLGDLKLLRHHGPNGLTVYRELQWKRLLPYALGHEDGEAVVAAGAEQFARRFGDRAIVLWAATHRAKTGDLRVECLFTRGGSVERTWIRLDRPWDDKFVGVLALE